MKKLVKKVEGVEFLTGTVYSKKELDSEEKIVHSKNQAKFPDAKVCGTDLGVPFYNSKDDTMYLLFGDTFGPRGSGITSWRSSVMSYSKDYDLSDGLTFDGWYSEGKTDGYAYAVSEGKHCPREESKERTKIPQGGIEVNGVVYVYYESIRTWGKPGTWYVNYQGVLKSTDNCKTFERVQDLTWFNSTTDENFDYANYSATWDYWGNDTDIVIERANEREAPYFSQAYPVDGKDGYVYIFGRKAGRHNGVKVARVKYENIEKFDEHEYYVGTDTGKAVWVKGYEGLKAINNDDVGFILASNENEPTSNMSVMYNEYLGKWMFVYFRPAKYDENGQMIYDNSVGFRLSDVPYGEYGEYHKMFDKSFFTKDGIHHSFMGVDWVFTRPNSVFYSAFVHEKYVEQKGKIFYIIISITNPIYNSILMKVELE